MHTHSHTYVCNHSYKNMNRKTRTHANTCTQAHTYTHTIIIMHNKKHLRTHLPQHTHTHTYSCIAHVQLLHEEVALMWLVSQSSKVQEDSMSVAWFFFGAMVTNITLCKHNVNSHNLTDQEHGTAFAPYWKFDVASFKPVPFQVPS